MVSETGSWACSIVVTVVTKLQPCMDRSENRDSLGATTGPIDAKESAASADISQLWDSFTSIGPAVDLNYRPRFSLSSSRND